MQACEKLIVIDGIFRAFVSELHSVDVGIGLKSLGLVLLEVIQAGFKFTDQAIYEVHSL